jgi:hypothetical protein
MIGDTPVKVPCPGMSPFDAKAAFGHTESAETGSQKSETRFVDFF